MKNDQNFQENYLQAYRLVKSQVLQEWIDAEVELSLYYQQAKDDPKSPQPSSSHESD